MNLQFDYYYGAEVREKGLKILEIIVDDTSGIDVDRPSVDTNLRNMKRSTNKMNKQQLIIPELEKQCQELPDRYVEAQSRFMVIWLY